jgi:hypothetical protein
MRSMLASIPAGLALVWGTTAGAQVHPGQRDTFEDGTTQNWTVGVLGAPHPAPPVNVPTGGPAGAGDNYLLLTAVGGNNTPGNRLTVVNGSQWTGNYLAAGVTGIALDANNLGGTDLFLRLLFENPMFAPPTDVAASATPLFLPAGSGWTNLFFPLFGPGGLVPLQGNLTTLLSNVTSIRIYHSPTLAFPGPPIVAQLGVDNITATAAPEPSTVLLVAAGLSALSLLRRRRGA